MHYPTSSPLWSIAPREDSLGAELADGHYSRQTPGADGFLAPGESLVLVHQGPIGRAVWGVVHNVFKGVQRWRNTIFRNVSGTLSSSLIESATLVTFEHWSTIYTVPSIPLRTEVDIDATALRQSVWNQPGHCYLMAGWRKVRDIPRGHGRSAKVELEAVAA
jgi:hypothetical protein